MPQSGTLARTAPAWIAGIGAPFLLLIRPDFVEPAAAWLFVLTIWAGLFATFLYLRSDDQAPLPLLPLSALFYVVFFALPPFVIEREWWSRAGTAEEPYGVAFATITTYTATLVLAGVVAMLACYYGSRHWMGRLPRLRLPPVTSPGRLRAVLWLLAAAHIVFLYVPELRSMSSVAQAMTPIGYTSVGMLFVLWYRGHLTDVEKAVYWGLVTPLLVLVYVYDGLITPVLLLFTFLTSLYWYVKRRLAMIVLVTAFAVLYIFPVLKLSNIFITEQSAQFETRVTEKVDALGLAALLLSDAAQGRKQDPAVQAVAGKNVVAPILRRMSLVVLLQYAVNMTPEPIPYLGGATLGNLATNFIPRFLWPGKPSETLGQWFGHKYRILTPGDTITSINLPWLVEFYINFGAWGVVLGMALVGAFLALLEQVFLRPDMTDVEIVAGWALVFRFFYQESNISLMVGGFVPQVVFLTVLLYAALRLIGPAPRHRRPADTPPT